VTPVEFRTFPAPHVVGGYTVPRVMYQVLVALLPVAMAHVYVYGPGLVLQLAVAAATALLCEAAALRLRHWDASLPLRDGSVLVTAALLALCVPPGLPLWLTALGVAFAVLIANAFVPLIDRYTVPRIHGHARE